MLSPTLQELLKPAKNAIALIWFALVVSAVIYVVLAYMIQQKGLIEVSFTVDAPLIYLAVAVSAVAGAASLVAGKLVYNEKVVRQIYRNKPSLKELARTPNRAEPDPDVLDKLKTLDTIEAVLFSLKTPYMNAMMARLVAAELIAVIGLVLALITADFTLAAAFVAPAVVLMVLAYPRLESALVQARQWLQTE